MTAQLQHPGIVPLHDLSEGSEPSSLFYTMQFIKGRTLSAAAREYRDAVRSGRPDPLMLQKLLNAFLQICQVIAYAHSRGVIHRDLKGQNVVLGEFGEVIVLDWGMAKVENLPEPEPVPAPSESGSGLTPVVDSGDTHLGRTAPGAAMGTPGYMSPDQASGNLDQIGPRSDVYGLGAMLYEILVGSPPFKGSVGEVLWKVVNEDPVPPRRSVSSTPRALDAICMTCLARDPAARYPSASALAEDVQRFLADEPVSVCQEPWAERLRRWGTRHRTIVIASAATTIVATACLAVAALLLSFAKDRESAARADAVLNFKLALDTVERFFTSVADNPRLKAVGLEKLRRDLLTEAKDFYETIERKHGPNEEVGVERGRSYLRLAAINEDLGEYSQAIEFAKEALAIFDVYLTKSPDSPRELEARARALTIIGSCHQKAARLEPAEAAFQDSIKTCQRLLAIEPSNRRYRYNMASSLIRSGRFLGTSLHDVDRTVSAFREALVLCDRLVSDFPADDELKSVQAEAMRWLGHSIAPHDFATARPKLDRALEIATEIAARNPTSLELQMQLIDTIQIVTADYANARAPGDIRAINEKARRLSDMLAREHPDVPQLADDCAIIESQTAINTAISGDHAGGTAEADRILAKRPKSGRTLLFTACAYAVASDSARRDESLEGPERAARIEAYQKRAMELLYAARDSGLFAFPHYAKNVRTDRDLAPLRERKDFRDFLESIENPKPQ